MEIIINTIAGLFIFFIFRNSFLLFWAFQERKKTWLWSYIDYLKFYFRFKIRWIVMGNNSMSEQNAKILYWNFKDPKGPSYNHKFSKKAAKVVKSYIEDVF